MAQKQAKKGTETAAGAQAGVQPCQLARTVVLVGLMGVGKTTVGKRLASRLHVPFVDADFEIEKAAGCEIPHIFECYGEAAFRDGERRVIARLLGNEPHILATGGGAFMNPETRQKIKESAVSVWLKADVDTLVKRVKRRDNRPLLKKGDPKEILRKLAAERDPVYAEADISVSSSSGPHEHVVDDIIAALQDRQIVI